MLHVGPKLTTCDCIMGNRRAGKKTSDYDYSSIEFGYSRHCRTQVNTLIAKARRVADSATETLYITRGKASPTPGLSFCDNIIDGRKKYANRSVPSCHRIHIHVGRTHKTRARHAYPYAVQLT